MTENNARLITNDALFVVPMIRRRLLHIDRIQKQYQLSLSHVQIMLLLRQKQPLSISQISDGLDISKPNVTPLVDRLCQKGFVSRERSDNDRRMVNVCLTDAGKAALDAIEDDTAARVAEWLGTIPDEQEHALKNALDTLKDILGSFAQE